MNIFRQIKALFAVRSTIENVVKEIKMPTASGKPGWKTSEFWFNLATQAATLYGAVKGFIPPNVASIISISGVALYTIARTVSKAVSDVQAAKSGSTTVSTTAPVTTISTPA